VRADRRCFTKVILRLSSADTHNRNFHNYSAVINAGLLQGTVFSRTLEYHARMKWPPTAEASLQLAGRIMIGRHGSPGCWILCRFDRRITIRPTDLEPEAADSGLSALAHTRAAPG
jgi:hypothetical protein